MQSVGTRLREAREKKGFSLQDINARTRINSKNLVAIESDDVGDISSPFFYRSFVRQYAETVDLDFKILASSVEALTSNMRQPDLPGQGEHQVVRVAPIQARPKQDWSWILPTAFLVTVIVLGSGGYAYLKFYGSSLLSHSVVSDLFAAHFESTKLASAPAPRAPVQPPVVSVAPKAQPLVPELPEQNTVATTSDDRSAVKPVADKIHLELAATERTWLSVSADGKTAYTGILERAETKVLEGQDSARLRTGNAGGVNIIFNGKALGAIGPRGTTRTVVFSRTGYEIEPESTTLSSSHIGG